MATFTLHKNYITPAEQAELVAWAAIAKKNCRTRENLRGGVIGRRLSDYVQDLVPPPLAMDILYRIEKDLRMAVNNVLVANRLRYKLVIHERGADTVSHVDQSSTKYLKFFRAALLVQAADQGGIFRVDNVPVEFPELSMLSFIGDETHGVTNVAQGERILLRANWYKD